MSTLSSVEVSRTSVHRRSALVRLAVGVAAGAAVVVGLTGCSPSGGSNQNHNQNQNQNQNENQSSPVVVGSDGDGIVYKLSGPIASAQGCGPAAPATSTMESATTHIYFQDGVLHASLGAVTDVFNAYADYTGELHADGSFTVTDNLPLPATAGPSVLTGKFGDDGSVTGTWSVGIATDNGGCSVTLGPLSSWFYFGITHLDWRTALHVTTA